MLSCTKGTHKFPKNCLFNDCFLKDMSCLIPNFACVLLYRITTLLSKLLLTLKTIHP